MRKPSQRIGTEINTPAIVPPPGAGTSRAREASVWMSRMSNPGSGREDSAARLEAFFSGLTRIGILSVARVT